MNLDEGTRKRSADPAGAERGTICRWLLPALLLCSAIPASAQFELGGSVFAGGGGHSESAGHCLRLDATLGEASVGTASGGAFTISAGYAARFDPANRDALFDTGFEDCL